MAALGMDRPGTAMAQAWGRVLVSALGVAALAGAGQLGVAYGLGLVRFARTFPADGSWSGQLTWVAWFAALATLAGAAAGGWVTRQRGLLPLLGGRIAVAVSAGLGAAIVVPLTALPADAATFVGRGAAVPALEAALAALLGVVVGILGAVTVLSLRLAAVSVTLLVAAVWLIALMSVAPSLAPGADLPEVRLGVLDLPALGAARSTVAVLSAPMLAALVCGAVAAAARSRGLSPLLTAVSSTAAPGLLALTYLIGSPGTGDRAVQASPYAGALIAVAAGLLVALTVGVVRVPSRTGASDADLEPAAPGAPVPPPVPPPAGSESSPTESTDPASWFSASAPVPTSPAPPVWPPPTEPASAPPVSSPTSPAPPPAAEPPWSAATPLEPPAVSSAPADSSPAEPTAPGSPPGESPKPAKRPRWTRPSKRSKAAPSSPPPAEPAASPSEPPAPAESAESAEPPAPAAAAEEPSEPPAPNKSTKSAKSAKSGKSSKRAAASIPKPRPAGDDPDEPAASESTGAVAAPDAGEPAPPPKRSRRPRLPKVGRKSKSAAEHPDTATTPEPASATADEPAPAASPPPEPSPAPTPAPSKRRNRRDEEVVDWISSLTGKSKDDETPSERRRLRRDQDE